MSSSRLRPTLFALATLILSFAFILMLAEGVLRMLPVSERYLSPEDITPNNPILRFKRNGTFNFSEGPLLRLANRVRTNNDGFVNDQDYDPGARTPLLAVVGDSYIHAQMLPYPDTVQGRLAARVGTAGRVYSFAASGAPLSQYLAYARYTRDTYGRICWLSWWWATTSMKVFGNINTELASTISSTGRKVGRILCWPPGTRRTRHGCMPQAAVSAWTIWLWSAI